MLEDSHAHPNHEELTWNHQQQEIFVRPVDRSSSYLLITNSVKLAFDAPKVKEEDCEKCSLKIAGLTFARK